MSEHREWPVGERRWASSRTEDAARAPNVRSKARSITFGRPRRRPDPRAAPSGTRCHARGSRRGCPLMYPRGTRDAPTIVRQTRDLGGSSRSTEAVRVGPPQLPGETELRCRMSWPSDGNITAHLAVMFVHLPGQSSTRIALAAGRLPTSVKAAGRLHSHGRLDHHRPVAIGFESRPRYFPKGPQMRAFLVFARVWFWRAAADGATRRNSERRWDGPVSTNGGRAHAWIPRLLGRVELPSLAPKTGAPATAWNGPGAWHRSTNFGTRPA